MISVDELAFHNISFRKIKNLMTIPNFIEGNNKKMWKRIKKSMRSLERKWKDQKNKLRDLQKELDKQVEKLNKQKRLAEKAISDKNKRKINKKVDKIQKKVKNLKEKIADYKTRKEYYKNKLDEADVDFKKLEKKARKMAKRLLKLLSEDNSKGYKDDEEKAWAKEARTPKEFRRIREQRRKNKDNKNK